jgi:uncharacterized protein YlxP (DUF503 family)
VIVGVCHLIIEIPEAHSLKDKRHVVKSLTNRVTARFNVSIAEVDDLDLWGSAGIGIVAVSNSARHVDDTLNTVLRFVEDNLRDGFLADVHTEIMHL